MENSKTMIKKSKFVSNFKQNNRENTINESVLITILHKNPTNALTTLFTLLHSFTFQPSRGHPQGVLIHSVSRVDRIRVKM